MKKSKKNKNFLKKKKERIIKVIAQQNYFLSCINSRVKAEKKIKNVKISAISDSILQAHILKYVNDNIQVMLTSKELSDYISLNYSDAYIKSLFAHVMIDRLKYSVEEHINDLENELILIEKPVAIKSQSELSEIYIKLCEENQTKRPTQKQLAEISGISQSAWSRELSNPSFLLLLIEKLRKKINQAQKSETKNFWIEINFLFEKRIEYVRTRYDKKNVEYEEQRKEQSYYDSKLDELDDFIDGVEDYKS